MHPRAPRLALLLLAACGEPTTASTSATTSASATAGTTTAAATAATETAAATAATAAASTAATASSDATTGQVTAATTTGDTADTADTSAACACTPGALLGCADLLTAEVCAADCLGAAPSPCMPGEACFDGQGCTPTNCVPGETLCADDESTKTCKADGSDYDAPVPCADDQGCHDNTCKSLCAIAELSPRSLGCSFFARTMDNYCAVVADSVIVGNTHPSKAATVQLHVRKNGVEAPVGEPVKLAPGAVHDFQLTEPEIEAASELRADGAYRVSSDIPIVAYQHAPRGAQLTNDASMLLPEPALARNYVIASAREGTLHKNHASYFVVIPVEDDTTVTWTPPVDTLAGAGVPAVKAGQQGAVVVDRLATLQVAAAFTLDLTGTYVSADKPIWVVGASACVSEPTGSYTCDHIEEQMIPIDYWGKTYVAARAPKRGGEKYRWRVFGGQDGAMITTTPDVSNGPFVLNKGQVKVLTATDHFVITGTGAFMPVQYLESQTAGAGTGDPSTVQMIPVEQFLDRYVFATGSKYAKNYVQVIREVGGAAVQVDGVAVTGYVKVGNYEVADWPIGEGSHLAESAEPFGIINIGYTDFTSYAYPGGMKLDVITPQ